MLTTTELGDALGIAKSTVLKLAKGGSIPAYKLDNDRGDYRFDLEEVKAALRVNGEAKK